MLKIKLTPRGKKHQITYRIVIAECRSKFDGKFIDDIGFYTPQTKTIKIDEEKFAKWKKNGAQLTKGVDKLINPDKYPNKKKNKKNGDSTEETSTPEVKVAETKVEEVKEVKKEEVKEVKVENAKETKTEEVKKEK
jgi:small subunit ribosomal protein S16